MGSVPFLDQVPCWAWAWGRANRGQRLSQRRKADGKTEKEGGDRSRDTERRGERDGSGSVGPGPSRPTGQLELRPGGPVLGGLPQVPRFPSRSSSLPICNMALTSALFSS